MFHETKLVSIHRVATRRVELALALGLEEESEITAAVEELSHVLYSALLVLAEVDCLASEAKQRQALRRLANAPNPTMALVDQQDARVVNRVASHLPKLSEVPKGSDPSQDQIKAAIAAAFADLGAEATGPVTGDRKLGATPVRAWTRGFLVHLYRPATDATI